MAETFPIARSPITQAPPVVMLAAWRVSPAPKQRSARIVDCTPYPGFFRSATSSPSARALDAGRGRVRRDESGALVAGVGPEEWIVIGPPGAPLPSALSQPSDGSGPSAVMDLTHARALIRIVGADSARVMSKLCGIDFGDATTPDDTALRTSVAVLVAGDSGNLARRPRRQQRMEAGSRSYLIMCERSAGQYLFDALLDAGQEFGIDIEGFAVSGSIYNGGMITR